MPLLRSDLTEVAAVFLRLGAIGFGGPAAHIALLEAEVVTRRQWISQAQF
jgi:chromate transporter